MGEETEQLTPESAAPATVRPSANRPAMDRKLVALLTGDLGDTQKIGKISADFGAAFSAMLADLIKDESGLELGVSYSGFASGLKNDLIADLDDFMILSDGNLKGWCPDFTIACPATIVIAMVETLLGGSEDDIVEPVARPASKIELKMSQMLFDRIAQVIRTSVDMATPPDPVLTRPVNAEDRPAPDDDVADVFATEIRMAVSYGPIVSQLSVIIPQKTLLKTKVKPPKARGAVQKGSPEFTEQIAEQIRRSDVRLEARISLETVTLGILSRLQAGDVIPFRERGEVRVDVSANGKELYVAEFGRAGEHYTVRVKDTHGSESDLIEHLMR